MRVWLASQPLVSGGAGEGRCCTPPAPSRFGSMGCPLRLLGDRRRSALLSRGQFQGFKTVFHPESSLGAWDICGLPPQMTFIVVFSSAGSREIGVANSQSPVATSSPPLQCEDGAGHPLSDSRPQAAVHHEEKSATGLLIHQIGPLCFRSLKNTYVFVPYVFRGEPA